MKHFFIPPTNHTQTTTPMDSSLSRNHIPLPPSPRSSPNYGPTLPTSTSPQYRPTTPTPPGSFYFSADDAQLGAATPQYTSSSAPSSSYLTAWGTPPTQVGLTPTYPYTLDIEADSAEKQALAEENERTLAHFSKMWNRTSL